MAYVWEHSSLKGTELNLLLAIADYANREGVAWPSIGSLAKRIRCDSRTTQRCLKRIPADELRISKGTGPHGTHLYQVIINVTLPLFAEQHEEGGKLPPVSLPGMAPKAKRGGVATPPEPSVTISKAVARQGAPRGSRLGKDWTLPIEWRRWALDTQPSWDDDHCTNVTDIFKDYWTSTAGSRGVKLDWEATWRNWVRKEAPRSTNRQKHAAWWESTDGIMSRGQELNIQARPGETIGDYKHRLFAAGGARG